MLAPLNYVQFLGEAFNKWVFPGLLVLLVLLNICGLYSKLMECIGLKSYAFDTDYQEVKVEEGKKIIEQYKNERILLLSQKQTKKKILPDIEKQINMSKKLPDEASLDESQELMFST